MAAKIDLDAEIDDCFRKLDALGDIHLSSSSIKDDNEKDPICDTDKELNALNKEDTSVGTSDDTPVSKATGGKMSDSYSRSVSHDTSRLCAAIKHERSLLVRKFLMEGDDANEKDENGVTLLHLAVYYNNPYVVKQLIKYLANVNAATFIDQNTPLHIAAENGSANIVRILLSAGAGLRMVNSRLRSPLYLAIKAGHLNVVIEIVDFHHRILQHPFKKALMHAAAKSGSTLMVQYLLDEGLDINIKDKKGRNALSHAVIQNNFEMVSFLTSRRVNIIIVDKDGNPFDLTNTLSTIRIHIECLKQLNRRILGTCL